MSLTNDFPRGHDAAPEKSAKLATAAWSTDAPLWREGMIWLGRRDDGAAIGNDDNRHMLTIAGSRAGKGTSAIVPNLCLWPGSCVVIDPKGENAGLTAETRSKRAGHTVVVLDPFGEADVPASLRTRFNPLELIDFAADDAIDVVAAIGDALTVGSDAGNDVHWTESARQIIEAVILHVAANRYEKDRSHALQPEVERGLGKLMLFERGFPLAMDPHRRGDRQLRAARRGALHDAGDPAIDQRIIMGQHGAHRMPCSGNRVADGAIAGFQTPGCFVARAPQDRCLPQFLPGKAKAFTLVLPALKQGRAILDVELGITGARGNFAQRLGRFKAQFRRLLQYVLPPLAVRVDHRLRDTGNLEGAVLSLQVDAIAELLDLAAQIGM